MRSLSLLLLFAAFLSSNSYSQQQLNTQLLGVFDPPTSDLPVFAGVQFNDVWGYASPGGMEIAILGNSRYNLFIDVTNPAVPVELFRHSPGTSEIWRDFKTYGSYAYGVCDGCNEGLAVYDMSDVDCSGTITHVRQVTSQFGSSHNIYIDEDNHRLYAVGVSGSTDMYIYDLLNDPSNPQLITSINFNVVLGSGQDFYVHDIYVRDNIAYCSHGWTGYYIWDLNDLSNVGAISSGGTIDLLGSIETNGYNHSSWITDDGLHAVVAEEVPDGLPLITLSLDLTASNRAPIIKEKEFTHKLEVGTNSSPTAHNPYIRNDFVFLSYYEDGLKVFDYSDPVNPVLHAYYDTYTTNNGSYSGTEGAWGCYPYLPSGNILVSDIDFGLHILSVTGTETCADGIQNQDETGIDCGGRYCLPCDNCTDGIQNQDETGIDCGGSICCAPCIETCNDGIQNQGETAIDCGGPACLACPTCVDGFQNQDETGVDCGGSSCQACDCTMVSTVINSDITTNTVGFYQSHVITNGPVTIDAPISAQYYAGNYLTVNPEFEVKLGAELLLSIDVCQ